MSAQTTYFIKYKENVSLSEIEQKVQQDEFIPAGVQLRLQAETKSVDHLAKGIAKSNEVLGRIVKITFTDDVDEGAVLQLQSLDENIEYIQKATTYQIDFVPNDSLVSQQWALSKIQAFDAWDKTQGADSVLIGVIDTGIDYFHPDLQNKIFQNPGEMGMTSPGDPCWTGVPEDKRFNDCDDDENGFIDDYRGWDFTDRVGFPFDSSGGDYLGWDNDPMDDNKHGTYISGIAAAQVNNSVGIAGAAPNIMLMNLRAFDPGGFGEEDDVAAAILYAVQMGAKVLNMSFGDYSFSYVLRDVIQFAYSKNLVLVGSSGNRNSANPHYPSGYSEVICVGNSTQDDFRAGSSNYGSTLDLMAPGTQVITTARNNKYGLVSGTSAATPHVAAAAALILSIGNFSNEEVKQILKSTSDDIGEPGWDIFTGAGRLNMHRAVTVTAPSIIRFNHPKQDFATLDDSLKINATVLSPLFSSYSLYYGYGLNPISWITLIEQGSNQFVDNDIFSLNLASLPDNVYCLRLVVQQTNGRTLEERVNFHVIRTPPGVIEVASGTLYYGDKSTVAGEFYTDQLSVMRLFYRKFGETNFNYVTLDGFNTNNQFVKQLHYGFIPKEIVQPGTLYEVYFEAENLVGLKTTIVDTLNNLNYFRFLTADPPSVTSYDQMVFKLPKGFLYNYPVSFLSDNYDEVLFQTFYETPNLIFGLFKYQNNEFVKIDSVENRFPKLFGDFNNNGLKELISTSRQNIFIEEQLQSSSFDSLVTKYTDINSNNPLIMEDLDLDGDYELITLSQGSILIKWDINSNLEILNPNIFYTRSDTLDPEPGYEFSNYPSTNIEIADINGDGKKEIWFLDADGDLKSYIAEPSGSLIKGNSFITQGLTTRNSNIFSIGDYDGDGIKDFAILYQTNSIAPTFLLLVVNYINNQFDIITQKVFLDQSAEFIGFSFSEAYQSLKFADVDNDGVDELILNIFPYSYILKYDFLGDKFIYFSDGVNTESIFSEDLNGNGIIEVAYQFSDGYKFFEFGPAIRPEIPVILSAFCNSSLRTELNWIYKVDQYNIYKGTNADSLTLYDSVFAANSYQDFNVEEFKTYYYAIQAYDPSKPEPLSKLSTPLEIYIHKPAIVDTVYAGSERSVIVKFSEKMKNTIENLQAFKLLSLSDAYPNSISPSSQYSYLVTFRENIPSGPNQIAVSGLRDLYGSPIAADTIDFIMPEIVENPEFFISSFRIVDAYNVRIFFNEEVDEATAANVNNYIFDPDNKASSVTVDAANKKIVNINLKGQKPVGSIGREYVLRVKDVFSSASTGSLKINEGAGSYIVLSSFANDLSDVYVYPNPVKPTNGEALTFANLPRYAQISIWTVDGTKIGEIEESDGNGGVTFNLRDLSGNTLSSGIYIYRIVMLDESKNEQEEKLGKFAVIK